MIEHTLTNIAYGVAETRLPGQNGSTEKGFLLKFAVPDESESWVIPLSEKVAKDIANLLSGTTIRPATIEDLRKLGG